MFCEAEMSLLECSCKQKEHRIVSHFHAFKTMLIPNLSITHIYIHVQVYILLSPLTAGRLRPESTFL